ncbi:hypothetical protein [Gordonia sp. MP11Mi]|uniref:Uncharacterized protein n=1 Tax=Gordonia sp. MP11Mi TaxID=3022769 RepID=A0AA97CZ48_9ACTN
MNTAFIADAAIETDGVTRQSADLHAQWSRSVTTGGTTVARRNHFNVFSSTSPIPRAP